MTGPGISPSTCVTDSQNLSKANLCRFQRLFITIAHLRNPSKFRHPSHLVLQNGVNLSLAEHVQLCA